MTATLPAGTRLESAPPTHQYMLLVECATGLNWSARYGFGPYANRNEADDACRLKAAQGIIGWRFTVLPLCQPV